MTFGTKKEQEAIERSIQASHITRRNKYRIGCLVQFSDGQLVLGEMTRDGQLYIFPHSISTFLDQHYPTKNKQGWYFNSTKDRYIAEICHDGIAVNPSFVDLHVTERIYDGT